MRLDRLRMVCGGVVSPLLAVSTWKNGRDSTPPQYPIVSCSGLLLYLASSRADSRVFRIRADSMLSKMAAFAEDGIGAKRIVGATVSYCMPYDS